LKLDNIIITKEGLVKIIDLGLSKDSTNECLKTIVGSGFYMAPEILSQENGCYTSKCDIWSIGIILHKMLTGKEPYVGNTQEEIIALI